MSDIALLSPRDWPEVRRGGERLVRELAGGLIAAGQHPTLITSRPGIPRRRREGDLRVLALPRLPQGPLDRRGFDRYLGHLPATWAATRLGGYGLVHAMYPTDARVAAAWKRRTGGPALMTYLGIPDAAGLDQFRLHRRLVAHAVEHLDAVVAISAHAAAAFADSFGYAAPVIHPGVDLDVFRPAAVRDPRPTILCAADPAEPRKHVGLLVEALGHVRRELPEARLILSAPRRLPAAPGVEWHDLDDRSVLARELAGAHVAALPAESEAFGLVLAEALACATPVVGYADAAIPELIDAPELGRLFHRLDARVLADSLLELLDPRTDTDAARAARRARAADCSTEAATRAYLALYRRLGLPDA